LNVVEEQKTSRWLAYLLTAGILGDQTPLSRGAER